MSALKKVRKWHHQPEPGRVQGSHTGVEPILPQLNSSLQYQSRRINSCPTWDMEYAHLLGDYPWPTGVLTECAEWGGGTWNRFEFCVCVCESIWRPRKKSDCHSSGNSPWFLRQGFLLAQCSSSRSGRLSSEPQGSTYFHSPCIEISGHYDIWLFMWVLGSNPGSQVYKASILSTKLSLQTPSFWFLDNAINIYSFTNLKIRGLPRGWSLTGKQWSTQEHVWVFWSQPHQLTCARLLIFLKTVLSLLSLQPSLCCPEPESQQDT